MLRRVKKSRTILYIILVTMVLLALGYSMLGDTKVSETVKGVVDAVSEVDLEQLSNVVADSKFASILVK